MNRTKSTSSFSDLGELYTSNLKKLCVRSVKRTFLTPADAIYDFTVGHDFVVVDTASPFCGCIVSCLDRHALIRHGYAAALIEYNNDLFVEVNLNA